MDEHNMKQKTFLDFVPTANLIEHLKAREGVETSSLAPGVMAEVKVSGPAIILVVID